MAAITGGPYDKRALSCVTTLYGAKLIECPLEKYYTDPKAFVDGQAAVLEILDQDILTSPMTLIQEGQAFGSEIKFFKRQAPNMTRPAISSIKDVSKLEMPDVDSHPRLVYTREAIRGLGKKFGKDKMIAAIVASPMDMPLMIVGMEEWLPAVLEEGDDAQRMLDITIPFFLEWTKALKDDGVNMLALPSPFTSSYLITKEMLKRFVLPILNEVYSKVELPLVLHHTGSRSYEDYFDILKDVPNVAGYVIAPDSSRNVARKRLGNNRVILSGIDGANLDTYTPEQVREMTMRVLEERRDDPNFIFACTGPDITLDTPIESLVAIRKALNRFGNGS